MRMAEDLGYRARNWFWYWQVRQTSQLSNQRLDEKVFGDVGRKRHFERIQHSASSPDRVAVLGGPTLVELVDRWGLEGSDVDRPFATATIAFHSRLWEFLTKRDIAPQEYTDFVQSTVASRGWHRIHGRDFGLYRRFLGEAEPASNLSGGVAFSAMLHRLANDAAPDSLALLVALFREAVYAVRLQEALLIKPAIKAATGWMCRQVNMPETETRLLARLVDDRVLSNVWITESDWRDDAGCRAGSTTSSWERLRQFREWVAWYTRDRPQSSQSGFCASPIVPLSPRIGWLESNREVLEQIHRVMCEGDSGHQYRCYDATCGFGETWVDSGNFVSRVNKELQQPTAPSPRFYSSSPPLEIETLPRSY